MGALPTSPVTIGEAKSLLTRMLAGGGIESASLDSRILIAHATGLSAAQMISNSDETLSPEHWHMITKFRERRLRGEPVDIILGYKDFWKDRFVISKDVLSPRPETEGIISRAMALMSSEQISEPKMLELGVGSGALILSLLREYPHAPAVGVDISSKALAIARANAKALSLDCEFVQSDWYSSVSGEFDLIVSNPPYITGDEMKALPKTVFMHDPKLALCGGEDGLEAYRRITQESRAYLRSNGYLIFEIGASQGQAVKTLMLSCGFKDVHIDQDLAGHDRIVYGRRGE